MTGYIVEIVSSRTRSSMPQSDIPDPVQHGLKVDRNGSFHFYQKVPCWKCEGRGIIRGYEHVDSGVCYTCDGSGRQQARYKAMLPAHYEKLEQKRAEKKERDAQLRREAAEREAYLQKEKEKERKTRAEQRDQAYQSQFNSEYVGEIKEKLQVGLELLSYHSWESVNSYTGSDETMHIYTFIDGEKHPFVWFTSSDTLAERYDNGEKVAGLFSFRVKKHEEYRNVKQTAINYVKEVK